MLPKAMFACWFNRKMFAKQTIFQIKFHKFLAFGGCVVINFSLEWNPFDARFHNINDRESSGGGKPDGHSCRTFFFFKFPKDRKAFCLKLCPCGPKQLIWKCFHSKVSNFMPHHSWNRKASVALLVFASELKGNIHYEQFKQSVAASYEVLHQTAKSVILRKRELFIWVVFNKTKAVLLLGTTFVTFHGKFLKL